MNKKKHKRYKDECRCTDENSPNSVTYNKSRVTILGQLGRTENDKYILTCSAKINDEPIAAEFLPTDISNKEQLQYQFKDFRVASQSVQVNLREKTKTLKQNEMSINSNQATQCNFEKLPLELTSQEITNELNIVKKCNSPMLVISIYPRADVTLSADKVTRRSNFSSRTYSSLDRSQNRRNLKDVKDNALSQRNRRRSASPFPKNIGRTKIQNKTVVAKTEQKNDVYIKSKSNVSFHNVDTNFKTIEILDRSQNKRNVKAKNDNAFSQSDKSRTPSPTQKNIDKKRTKNKNVFIQRTPTKPIIQSAITNFKTRDNFNRTQNRRQKEKTGNQDIFSECNKSRSISPTPKNKDNEKRNSKNLYIQRTNTINDNNTNQLNNSTFNINTKIKTPDINEPNTVKVKKALVDSFISNLDTAKENTKCLLSVPKSNASRITINLDGENEHYDVVLVKSNDNTGLSVTKTLKTKASKHKHSNSNVNSLEHFLMLRDSKANEKGPQREGTNQIIKPKIKYPGSLQLKVRDSLDLSRGCDLRSSCIQEKKQTDEEYDNNRKSVFSGTTKHYRGENCTIKGPSVRYKEISQILDLLRDQHKTSKSHKNSETILKRSCLAKCSKTLITNINSTQWLIRSSSHTPNDSGDQNMELSGENKKLAKSSTLSKFIRPAIITDQKYSNVKKNINLPALSICANNQQSHNLNLNYVRGQDKLCDYNSSNLQSQSQRLEWIQNYIFFQIRQPSKRRQNLITKRQHTRLHVTKNAKNNVRVSEKEKNCYSLISLGEVKVKENSNKLSNFDRGVQTEKNYLYNEKSVQTVSKNIKDKVNIYRVRSKSIRTISKVESEKKVTEKTICLRPVVSAMELQSTVAYFQQDIRKAYLNLKGDGHNLKDRNNLKNRISLHTIYKGRKKSMTPNLGTSLYYKHSNSSTNTSGKRKTSECKSKKHFLRRFLSCLLMRFHQISNMNLARKETCYFPSANTSIDSYHINTSLGAWDMSSLFYDTSASFYTGHNIYPTTKTKRGFLSSIRGFITKQKL